MNSKRGIALLMVMLLMLGLLGGCRKNDQASVIDSNVDVFSEEEIQPGVAEEDLSENSDKLEDIADDEWSWPLEEQEEISVWTLWSSSYVDSISSLRSIQELEERTNVKVNWVTVSRNEASEKFGLMIASGDTTDIIYSGGKAEYQNGGIQGVEDGVYLDCTELIENYMPNYQELRTASENLKKDTMTDDGRMICVYSLPSNDDGTMRELEWLGFGYRKDLADTWGIDTPVTIDDWHTFLTMAKENGYSAPLLLNNDGTITGGAFLTAYGVLDDFYLENGEVKYGPKELGYRQYVELMRQWFSEGLIDPDFMAGSDTVTMFVTEKTVASSFGWMYAANGLYTNGLTDNDKMWVQAVNNPVLNESDIAYGSPSSAPAAGNPIYFSAKCENPELAARWLDYLYSEEGMFLMHYGIEGDTYIIEDGIYFTKQIMDNEEYSPSDTLKQFAAPNTIGRYDWEYLDHLNGDSVVFQEQKETWNSNDMSLIIPEMATLSAEDAYTYNNSFTNIETLVNETTIKAITGTISMDEFEEAIESLDSYGLQACIDGWQAAVERYNDR